MDETLLAKGAEQAPSQATDVPRPLWLDDLEQQVWRSYLLAHSELMAHLHRRLQAASQLSLPDYEVLVQLTESLAGSARVFELSRNLQWEKSRLSHHLKRMEARGLVMRNTCPTDARGAIVSITPHGQQVIDHALPSHMRDVRRLFFEVLTPEQVRVLGDICSRVVERVTADAASSPETADGVPFPVQPRPLSGEGSQSYAAGTAADRYS